MTDPTYFPPLRITAMCERFFLLIFRTRRNQRVSRKLPSQQHIQIKRWQCFFFISSSSQPFFREKISRCVDTSCKKCVKNLSAHRRQNPLPPSAVSVFLWVQNYKNVRNKNKTKNTSNSFLPGWKLIDCCISCSSTSPFPHN